MRKKRSGAVKHLRWGRIILAILVVVFLICGAFILKDVLSSVHSAQSADSSSVVESMENDSPAENHDQNQPVAPTENRMKILISSGQTRRSCYSDTGYYYFSDDYLMKTACNLKYVDFETKQEIFLCGNPNCTHTDESCASYYNRHKSAQSVVVINGRLLVIDWGMEGPGFLEVRNLDGTEPRKLLTLTSGEEFSIGCIAADDEYLYYVRTVYGSGANKAVHKLEKINIETAKVTTLYTLRSDEECMEFFVAANDDCLIIRGIEGVFASGNTTFVHKAIGLDGTVRDDLKMPEPYHESSKYLYFYSDGTYLEFCKHQTNCEVSRRSIYSDEKEVVLDELEIGQIGNLWIGATTSDNMLPITVDMSEDEVYRYILNLTTGELKKNSLAYETVDGRTRNVAIEAEYNDYFFVQKGETMKSEFVAGDRIEGNRLIFPFQEYAMILKADFYNNNPQYVPISKIE